MITSLDGTYTDTWQGFVRHVLASDYGAFLRTTPCRWSGLEATRSTS